MSAIRFVVRDGTGNLQRGTVLEDGDTATLNIGSSQDISLNLRRSEVASFDRQGSDLVVTLTDGSVLTLGGYFVEAGAVSNQLFLSDDGFLTEVQISEQGGDLISAYYSEAEAFGKWSADDALFFTRGDNVDFAIADAIVTEPEAGMLGTALLTGLGGIGATGAGAAVAGGAALLVGGGGGGGGDNTPPEASITAGTVSVGHTVNAVDHGDGVDVSGVGEPGAALQVTVDGNTRETIVAENGTWTVTYEEGVLEGGEYTLPVSILATDEAGNTATSTDTLHIDILAHVTLETETVEQDGVVSAAEANDGITITGTTEIGSTVSVQMGSVTHMATVADDGTWTSVFAASEIPAGDYEATVVATATDPYGNTASTTSTLDIDTITSVAITSTQVEGENVVNGAERTDGVVLTGTAAPGSSVSVAIGDATYDAAVANDGTWSVTYPATDFPNGEYELTAIATATDAVGNVATASHTFDVDTYVNDLTKTGGPVGGDGVINIAEAAEGVSLTGTVEPGSTVQVTLGGVTLPAVVQPNGDWSVAFNGAQIPTGETPTTLTIDATDAAQNTTSISETVQIDRDAGFLTLSADPIEGDDVINFDEASDGVVLHGTATPGAVVNVTFGGVEHTAVSDVNGNWTTTYLQTEVAGGTYPSSITATTTDSAGNTLSVADSVRVDTVVDNLGIQQPIEGDNIISQSDAANGVLISGTSEVGSTVVVAFGTSSLTTVADSNGNWNVTFPASTVPAAEIASTAVTATATDLAGNVRDVSANVRIDTIVSNMSISGTAVEGDNVVNASEYSDGVVLNGTTEIGSTVSVAINGVSQQATVAPNGDWSISFDPATLPFGDYTANVVVTATDAVGNVKSLNTSFDVDTQAPDAPLIRSFDKDARDGVVEIGTETTTDTFTITEITAGGSANNVTFTQTENTLRDRTDFEFTHGVPDGSQLVVTADDASGNSNSTLFVLDDVATDIVDLNVAALGQFDIGSINLSLAEDSQLTITADDLESLSSNSNTVRINGGSDDTVNIQGAVRANTTETINGQTFDVYSLGNEGGSLVINEDINVII